MSIDSTLLGEKSIAPGSLVTVFGGSGFVGRYIVASLAEKGYRVRVAVRRPNLAHDLRPMGAVGQVQPVQANIRHKASCEAAMEGASAVINLIGILQEGGRQTFDGVHAAGAGRLAKLAADMGVESFVQVSAIGADVESTSAYGRSKGFGEKAVLDAFPTACIVRPSIVFGPEDDFFNRFARMARLAPALPLIGGGQTRFQPVYVKDVADGVVACVEHRQTQGKVIEMGGPEVLTFKELMEMMLAEIERNRVLLPIPFALMELGARLTQWAPLAPITTDQIEMLKVDNVVSEDAVAEGRTLAGLGIDATAARVILPSYLVQYRKTGEFREQDSAA